MNTDKIYLILAVGLVGIIYIFFRKKAVHNSKGLKIIKSLILLGAAILVGVNCYKHFNALSVLVIFMTLMVLGYILKQFWFTPDED